MSNHFKKIMSQHSDEKLLKIIGADRINYQREAVEAAEAELAARNTDPQLVKEAVIRASEEQTAEPEITITASFKVLRLVNMLIDYIIVYAMATTLVFILSGLLVSATWLSQLNASFIHLIIWLLYVSVYIGYFYLMEMKFGKTVGKFVTKTHVESLKKIGPSKGDLLARSFLRLLPFDPIWYVFSNDCWHDSLSDTKVVRD